MRNRLSGLMAGLAVALALAADGRPLEGQGLGASIHAGTMGIGARLAVPITSQVNLRSGIDLQPFAIEVDLSDVLYDLNLSSPNFSGLLDWHPGGGSFRLSGGATYFSTSLELEGTPRVDVDIGGREYSPGQLGTLVGTLGTSQWAPYAGIGWGNSPGGGFSLSLDLGVAFHGTPDATLRATGPVGSDPQFASDLEAELVEVNDDIERVKAYPVLNLGLGFGL